MDLRQLALVSQTPRLALNDLLPVAAALQKQITRDFTPIWNKPALISAFAPNQVPLGYWPIFIRDDIGAPGAAGFHEDKNHQPFAMVQFGRDWSLTVSHEMLEMLVDPFGNKLKVARSIKPGQGKVQYLVEVCDPSEGKAFAYDIQGVLVSDFYTPDYFDKLFVTGKRYSFTGAITQPLQVLKDGYISWFDPSTGKWWQAQFFGTRQKFVELTAMQNMTEGSLRNRIDSITKNPLFDVKNEAPAATRGLGGVTAAAQPDGELVANHWEEAIQTVLKKYNVK
jgi:hypothetical protein